MAEILFLIAHVWAIGIAVWFAVCVFAVVCYYYDYCRSGDWSCLRDARKWLLGGLWAPLWPLALIRGVVSVLREILEDGKENPRG